MCRTSGLCGLFKTAWTFLVWLLFSATVQRFVGIRLLLVWLCCNVATMSPRGT